MPLPFILGAVAAAAAVTGVAKGIDAKQKNNKAKEVNREAQSIYDCARSDADRARKDANRSLEWLGRKKLDILQYDMKRFVVLWDQIHHIEFNSYDTNELKGIKGSKDDFVKMKELSEFAISMAAGAVGGAVAGGLTALGAYGTAMTLGAASTGTAISVLSGAAATNATLAFLGGGSLAAGGLGIAGGTMVLGGLVAGPALAVLGFTMNAKAEKNLDNSYSNLAKARQIAEELSVVVTGCKKIKERSDMFVDLLNRLKPLLSSYNRQLERIISVEGTDFRYYSINSKNVVAGSWAVAKAIKSVIDTPILKKDGAINSESYQIIRDTKVILSKY